MNRIALPRGITKTLVAKYFSRGYSVNGLARKYRCASWVIECAIRDVLKRRHP